MKKSSNRVLIEHVGTATIHFDRDEEKALRDYVKENSVPGLLEDLIAISRPVKRARKGAS